MVHLMSRHDQVQISLASGLSLFRILRLHSHETPFVHPTMAPVNSLARADETFSVRIAYLANVKFHNR